MGWHQASWEHKNLWPPPISCCPEEGSSVSCGLVAELPMPRPGDTYTRIPYPLQPRRGVSRFRPTSNHPAWFAPSAPAPADDTDSATSLHRGHLPRPCVELTTRSFPPHCSVYAKQGQTSIKLPQDAEFNTSRMPFVGLWTGAETPRLSGWTLHSSMSGDARNSEHCGCSHGSSSPSSQRFGCWHLGQKTAAQPLTRAVRALSTS